MMRSLCIAVAVLLLGFAVSPAVAVEVRRDRDVYWVSGGVSADERDDMVLALPDHNLKLVTAAERSGAFLAGAQVVVRDADGRTVLETALDGPWLLARLPSGRYDLVATYGGREQTRSVTIPATGRRELLMHWAAPDVETVPKVAP